MLLRGYKPPYLPHTCTAATTMSLEAALDLSVPQLLRVLDEKIGLECSRVRGIRLPPISTSITSLEVEVSAPYSIYIPTRRSNLTVNSPDRNPRGQGT